MGDSSDASLAHLAAKPRLSPIWAMGLLRASLAPYRPIWDQIARARQQARAAVAPPIGAMGLLMSQMGHQIACRSAELPALAIASRSKAPTARGMADASWKALSLIPSGPHRGLVPEASLPAPV